MKIKNKIYKASVLLIAAVMVLSIIPAVTADNGDQPRIEAGPEGIFNPDPVINDMTPIRAPKLTGYRVPYADGTFGGSKDGYFEQVADDPSASWSIGTSDESFGYKMYENFDGIDDPTCIYYVEVEVLCADIGSGWLQGDPVGMDLHVEIYDDGPAPSNAPPTNLVDSFTLDEGSDFTWDWTGKFYVGLETCRFYIPLPSEVQVTGGGGWICVQSATGSPYNLAWVSSHDGDLFSYQQGSTTPNTVYDRALYFEYHECGGVTGDCIPDVCDFDIVGATFDGKDIEDEGKYNSLPHTIDIHMINWGEIPIYEVKLLADVYEKVCGDTTCWPWPINKDIYNPKYDDNNDNFTVYDDPADDIDDLGDTFTLQDEEFHSGGLAYRCTHGHELYSGAADKYIGRSAAIDDDALIFAPANKSRVDLRDKACVEFTFWHKTKGEYSVDDDGNVIPIDYGFIEYSLDDGGSWVTVPLSQFVAYDNEWEQVKIKIINTDANGGNYDTVCDYCGFCDNDNDGIDDADGSIIVLDDFTTATFFQIRWNWHVNPCNEYPGWYIDDLEVCITEEYELKLVHQTHEITDLPGCDPEVGPQVVDLDFALDFDPEPETWYKIVICGQVFHPQNCESNLDNNCWEAQIFITDIHDIACIGGCGSITLTKKTQCCEPDDENGEFEFTFKNEGTFPESNIPVDLVLSRKIVTYDLKEDFETDPSGRWNTYYFSGYAQTDLWDWTEGYNGVPPYRSAEDQPVGHESMLCAHKDLRPEVGQYMGNLLTNDEVYNIALKDACCESWALTFAAKWAFNPDDGLADPWGYYETPFSGGDGGCLLIHPISGPDSEYWWIIGMGWEPGTYSPIWEYYEITPDDIDGWFGYDDCDDNHIIPDIEFGFAVFTNSDGKKVNHDALDVFGNEFPWGGLMLDDIKISQVTCEANGDVVYSGVLSPEDPCDDDEDNSDPHEVLEPGEEETITLYWNDTQYCNWCAIGDVNLPNDVKPENDKCCMDVKVISDCSCLTDEGDAESEDLTGGETSLWTICTTDEGDDTVLTCTKNFGDYRAYEPNMDDMWASPDIDLGAFSLGATLSFDTYFRFFSWCDPNLGTRYDDGSKGWDGPPDDPIWKKQAEAGDFGEIYFRYIVDDGSCPGPGGDDCYSEWIFIDRLNASDYYDSVDPTHDTCNDDLPRFHDWKTLTYGIPGYGCTNRTQIGFRMVSNDLNCDPIPYCDDPDESEGWYIDDLFVGGTLKDYVLQEGFEGGSIPGTWTVVDYSGTGTWEIMNYGGATYYEPPGTGTWFATADSDSHSSYTFDTELFTEGMDLSGSAGEVTLSVAHAFEDYAGCGDAWIATYSGGTTYPDDLEDVLLFMTNDADDGVAYGGSIQEFTFDPSGYTDPTDVYVGFWYSTAGGTYCWSYSVDDVEVFQLVPGVPVWDEDFEGFGTTAPGMYPMGTPAGDYWEYMDFAASGFGLYCPDADANGDGEGWFCHGFPEYGRGLNDALVMEIPIEDDWTDAWFYADHSALIPPGTALYIELSTDGTNYITMWQFENYDVGDPTYIFCNEIKEIALASYIEQGLDMVYVRFRLTTEGNDLNDFLALPNGWWVDDIQIQCKIGVQVDETPPVTTLVFDDTKGEVCLFANDPGMIASGVAATYYKLDGGAQTTYTGCFTLTDGVHKVEYWSEDVAGNVETHKTSPDLIVDTEPPTIAITEPTAGLYLFGSKILSMGSQPICIGKVTIKADASDSGTGIQLVTFDVDGDSGYDGTAPYEYTYRGMKFGSAKATATAFDYKGLTASDSVDFTIFSLGLI
jgi:hypothetical protein